MRWPGVSWQETLPQVQAGTAVGAGAATAAAFTRAFATGAASRSRVCC